MNVNEIGAVCFGVVVGYLTYRTLVRTGTKSSLDDLPAVLAVIGFLMIVALDTSLILCQFRSIV